MRLESLDPPREFRVGLKGDIVVKHSAKIELESDEQVTFVAQAPTGYDVCRKSWGFYATPSVNYRLKECGFRGALICNNAKRIYVVLVEVGKEQEFRGYLANEQNIILLWLDDPSDIQFLLKRLVQE